MLWRPHAQAAVASVGTQGGGTSLSNGTEAGKAQHANRDLQAVLLAAERGWEARCVGARKMKTLDCKAKKFQLPCVQ